MSNQILKEFLIGVGFKVDGNSASKAQTAITQYEKAIVDAEKRIDEVRLKGAKTVEAREKVQAELHLKNLKRKLEETKAEEDEQRRRATAVAAGVATIAAAVATAMYAVGQSIKKAIGEFDQLYYASGRTGASVNNLKALGYAFKQTGSSAEAAMSAVDNFARARRSNPGIDAMLRGYGINTKGDTSEVLMNSIEAIRQRHPQFAGEQVAGLLGISPDEYDHLIRYRAEIARFTDEYKRLQGAMGVNGGETANAAKEIMRQFGRLSAVVEVLSDKIMQTVAPAIAFLATKLDSLVEFATDEDKRKKLSEYFDPIIGATKTLVKWVGELYDMFVKVFDYVRNSPFGKLLGAINPGFIREGILSALQPTSAEASEGGGSLEGGAGAGEKPGLVRRGWNAIKRGLGIGGEAVDKTPLGPVPQGLLDNIARAEGTYRTGYNTSLAHGRLLPGGKEQDLSSKSLREILQLGKFMRGQPGNPNSSALGRYQIVGSTLKAAAGALDMDLDKTKFDAETQDKMAHWIARRQGLNAWEGFKSHPAERAAAAAALARRDQSGGARPAPAPVASRPMPQMQMNPGGFDFRDYMNSAPMGSTSNVDNRRSAEVKIGDTNVTIHGSGDAAATAASFKRAQQDIDGARLRDFQTAIR